MPFPIPIPSFQPAIRVITAITNDNPASVTTSQNHYYVDGMVVRLDIPPGFGMQQANQQSGSIVVTGDTTFTIDIDTTIFDVFSVAGGSAQSAQSIPFGELNDQLNAAVQNLPPGGIL